MFTRIVMAALGAGLIVGVAIALVQHFTVIKLIAEGEVYERAALHDVSAEAIQPGTHAIPMEAVRKTTGADWKRFGLTAFATTMLAIGYALLLVGAIAIGGKDVTPREGVLWGLGGFAVFALAPSLGLPPELPGATAAELLPRQLWWAGCATATASGLALLAFGGKRWLTPLAVALIALPHVIGAPRPPAGMHGAVPPELAAQFAAQTIGIAAIFWSLLGYVSTKLYARLGSRV